MNNDITGVSHRPPPPAALLGGRSHRRYGHGDWRAGFDPAPGPETHRLSDGRVIPSRWFANVEPALTRCRSW
ncbi:hypothetical protein [Actinomadura geliboluensis]|uniref:Uncharacterized protein n=1 Tax=Actinomadura geliboluensis TaxID=882440 RepID=A0A5S4H5K9_9ACTN|nr:hypothetical protein [Actinomadura geliboluensis]TMR40299.1 hypothetical protein ETD96_11400 [Actinomadura geliboluensis]